MTDKKVIAVLGATGNQGGGLVRAVLDDPRGALRRTGHHAQRGFRAGSGTPDNFAKALNEPVLYRPMSIEQFRAQGLPTSNEFANVFRYYQDAETAFVGDRELNRVRRLKPRLQSFEQ
ncbi:hypothetical protein [Streptomyces sp. NBC_01497]|uniref:hypothetical protein n=1 Tax=Streptomyces sp. NBC_01497 TaxID=2903885 RepID=UPI002E321D33|nr:hypothetical protein [Streptomyces sp. NBC_01497]